MDVEEEEGRQSHPTSNITFPCMRLWLTHRGISLRRPILLFFPAPFNAIHTYKYTHTGRAECQYARFLSCAPWCQSANKYYIEECPSFWRTFMPGVALRVRVNFWVYSQLPDKAKQANIHTKGEKENNTLIHSTLPSWCRFFFVFVFLFHPHALPSQHIGCSKSIYAPKTAQTFIQHDMGYTQLLCLQASTMLAKIQPPTYRHARLIEDKHWKNIFLYTLMIHKMYRHTHQSASLWLIHWWKAKKGHNGYSCTEKTYIYTSQKLLPMQAEMHGQWGKKLTKRSRISTSGIWVTHLPSLHSYPTLSFAQFPLKTSKKHQKHINTHREIFTPYQSHLLP